MHHKGTAAWFIDDDRFEQWKANGTLLWIHGKPGSGKSVLSSVIIKDIQDLRKTGSDSKLAYFYCDFRDTAKQHANGLLSSFISQLSVQSTSCHEIVSCFYSVHNDGSEQPSRAALMECFMKMLRLPGLGAVYIIIDALDECPISGIPSPREEILEVVREVVDMDISNLRICVTSRPEPDIHDALQLISPCSICLHMERGQVDDMAAYIRWVIDSDSKIRKWRASDKALVIEALSQKANGMFQWVYCQLERLHHCLPATIRAALQTLPSTLDETYKRILEGIISIRPLHIKELAEVLAVDFDSGAMPQFVVEWRPADVREAVLSVCSALVAVDAETQVVQFAHFSVQEYLVSERLAQEYGKAAQFFVHPEPANAVMTKTCLGILLQFDQDSHQNDIGKFPLACYAAKYWHIHAKFMETTSCIKDAMECLFHPDQSHFDAWIWIWDMDDGRRLNNMPTLNPVHPNETPLYYAAICGFQSIAEYLIITHQEDVNAQGGEYENALQAAVQRGHKNMAEPLIQMGADVNAQGAVYGNALQAASQGGHKEIVELLIDNGASVNTKGKKYGNAL